MNADGSGVRPVAETKASDFKPVWSPDGANLLIISNRKSAFGGPRKAVDLWLTRVSDGEVLTPLGLDARTRSPARPGPSADPAGPAPGQSSLICRAAGPTVTRPGSGSRTRGRPRPDDGRAERPWRRCGRRAVR